MPAVVISFQQHSTRETLLENLHIVLLRHYGDGQIAVGVGKTPKEVQWNVEGCHALVVLVGQEWRPDELNSLAIRTALQHNKRILVALMENATFPGRLSKELQGFIMAPRHRLSEVGVKEEFDQLVEALRSEAAFADTDPLVVSEDRTRIEVPSLVKLGGMADLLREPRPRSTILRQVPGGSVLEVLDIQDDYMKVNVENQFGWITLDAMQMEFGNPAEDVTAIDSAPRRTPVSDDVTLIDPAPSDEAPILPPITNTARRTPTPHPRPPSLRSARQHEVWMAVLWIVILLAIGAGVVAVVISALT